MSIIGKTVIVNLHNGDKKYNIECIVLDKIGILKIVEQEYPSNDARDIYNQHILKDMYLCKFQTKTTLISPEHIVDIIN
jgi:hypothetical protein